MNINGLSQAVYDGNAAEFRKQSQKVDAKQCAQEALLVAVLTHYMHRAGDGGIGWMVSDLMNVADPNWSTPRGDKLLLLGVLNAPGGEVMLHTAPNDMLVGRRVICKMQTSPLEGPLGVGWVEGIAIDATDTHVRAFVRYTATIESMELTRSHKTPGIVRNHIPRASELSPGFRVLILCPKAYEAEYVSQLVTALQTTAEHRRTPDCERLYEPLPEDPEAIRDRVRARRKGRNSNDDAESDDDGCASSCTSESHSTGSTPQVTAEDTAQVWVEATFVSSNPKGGFDVRVGGERISNLPLQSIRVLERNVRVQEDDVRRVNPALILKGKRVTVMDKLSSWPGVVKQKTSAGGFGVLYIDDGDYERDVPLAELFESTPKPWRMGGIGALPVLLKHDAVIRGTAAFPRACQANNFAAVWLMLLHTHRPFLGLSVRHTLQGLEVVHVVPHSPACRAGILAGDVVTFIDTPDAPERPVYDVVTQVRYMPHGGSDDLSYSQSNFTPGLGGLGVGPLEATPLLPLPATPVRRTSIGPQASGGLQPLWPPLPGSVPERTPPPPVGGTASVVAEDVASQIPSHLSCMDIGGLLRDNINYQHAAAGDEWFAIPESLQGWGDPHGFLDLQNVFQGSISAMLPEYARYLEVGKRAVLRVVRNGVALGDAFDLYPTENAISTHEYYMNRSCVGLTSSEDIALLLVRHGFTVGISMALQCGWERVAYESLVLDSEQNVDDYHQGRTALEVCCELGNVALCALLLENGANPNIYSYLGDSPLYTAAKFPVLSIKVLMMETLLRAGAVPLGSRAMSAAIGTPQDKHDEGHHVLICGHTVRAKRGSVGKLNLPPADGGAGKPSPRRGSRGSLGSASQSHRTAGHPTTGPAASVISASAGASERAAKGDPAPPRPRPGSARNKPLSHPLESAPNLLLPPGGLGVRLAASPVAPPDVPEAEYVLARVKHVTTRDPTVAPPQKITIEDATPMVTAAPAVGAPSPASSVYQIVLDTRRTSTGTPPAAAAADVGVVTEIHNVDATVLRPGRWFPGCIVQYQGGWATVTAVATDADSAVDVGAGGTLTLRIEERGLALGRVAGATKAIGDDSGGPRDASAPTKDDPPFRDSPRDSHGFHTTRPSPGTVVEKVLPWEVDDIPFHEGAMYMCQLLTCDRKVPRVAAIVNGEGGKSMLRRLSHVLKAGKHAHEENSMQHHVMNQTLTSLPLSDGMNHAQSIEHILSEDRVASEEFTGADVEGALVKGIGYPGAHPNERFQGRTAFQLVTDEDVALYLLANTAARAESLDPAYAAQRGWLRVLQQIKAHAVLEPRCNDNDANTDALEENVDWEEPDEAGITPVAHAILSRRLDVLQFLLEAGALADGTIGSGHHYLFLAVDASHDVAASVQSSVDACDSDERYPSPVAFLEALVAANADLLSRTPEVVGYAARMGKVNAMDFLLTRLHSQGERRPVHAAKVKWLDRLPYEWTLREPSANKEAILMQLIEEGVSPSLPALIATSSTDQYLKALTRLLEKAPEAVNDVDPVTGNTALINACKYANLPAFMLLMDAGADVDVLNNYSKGGLFYAVGLPYDTEGTGVQMVRRLLAKGARVRRTEAVGYACSMGHVQRVRELLKMSDCDPNEQYAGVYPIDHAAKAEKKYGQQAHGLVLALCAHVRLDVWLADIAKLGTQYLAAVEIIARRPFMVSNVDEVDDDFGRSPLAWVAMSRYTLTADVGTDVLFHDKTTGAWGHATVALAVRPRHDTCTLFLADPPPMPTGDGGEKDGAAAEASGDADAPAGSPSFYATPEQITASVTDVVPYRPYGNGHIAYPGMSVLVRGAAGPVSRGHAVRADLYYIGVVEEYNEVTDEYVISVTVNPASSSPPCPDAPLKGTSGDRSMGSVRQGMGVRLRTRDNAAGRWSNVPAACVCLVGRRAGVLASLLIDLGANINAVDNGGKSVIFNAIQTGDLQTAELLLANGVAVKGTGSVFAATRRGCVSVLDQLLLLGGSLLKTWNGRYPAEVCGDNLEMVEKVITALDDVSDSASASQVSENLDFSSGDMRAATSRHRQAMERMRTQRRRTSALDDVNMKDLVSTQSFRTNVSSAAGDDNESHRTLPRAAIPSLWLCAQNGWAECVRRIAERYPHVLNRKGLTGVTAAAQACILGRLEILKILADAGAFVGQECLFLACQYGWIGCVEYLIKERRVAIVGSRCLPAASMCGHVRIIKALAHLCDRQDLEKCTTELYMGKNVMTGLTDEAAVDVALDSLTDYLSESHLLYFASRGMCRAVDRYLSTPPYPSNDGIWKTVNVLTQSLRTWPLLINASDRMYGAADLITEGTICVVRDPITASKWVAKIVQIVNHPDGHLRYRCTDPFGAMNIEVFECEIFCFEDPAAVLKAHRRRWDCLKLVLRWCRSHGKSLKQVFEIRGREDNLNHLFHALRTSCWEGPDFFYEGLAGRWDDVFCDRIFEYMHRELARQLCLPKGRRCNDRMKCVDEDTRLEMFTTLAKVMHSYNISGVSALDLACKYCWVAAVDAITGTCGIPPTASSVKLICKRARKLMRKYDLPALEAVKRIAETMIERGAEVPVENIAVICGLKLFDSPDVSDDAVIQAVLNEDVVDASHRQIFKSFSAASNHNDDGTVGVGIARFPVVNLRWWVELRDWHVIKGAKQVELREFASRQELGLHHLAARWNNAPLLREMLRMAGVGGADDCDNQVTMFIPRDYTTSRKCHSILLESEEKMDRIPEVSDIDLILEVDPSYVPFDLVQIIADKLCNAASARDKPHVTPDEIKWQINRLDCGAFLWQHPVNNVTYIICNASTARLEAEARSTMYGSVTVDPADPSATPTFSSGTRQLLVEHILETLSGDLEYYRCHCGVFNARGGPKCVNCEAPQSEIVLTDRWLSTLVDSGNITRAFGVHDKAQRDKVSKRWQFEPFRSFCDYFFEKRLATLTVGEDNENSQGNPGGPQHEHNAGILRSASCYYGPQPKSRNHNDGSEGEGTAGDEEPKDPTEVMAGWYTQAQLLNEYFGTKLTFYFMFVSFYLAWLTPLLVTGAFFTLWQWYQDTIDTNLTIISSILSILWVSLLAKMWSRKASELAFLFHVREYEVLSIPSAQYLVNNRHRAKRKHPVTGMIEPHFTSFHRFWRYVLTYLVTAIMIAIVIVVMWFNYRLRQDLDPKGDSLSIQIATGVENAVTVIALNTVYESIVGVLCNFENHRTDEAREQSVILKTFFFQLVNGFSGLTLTVVTGGSARELLTQVASLMIVQSFSSMIKEKVIVWIYVRYKTTDVLNFSVEKDRKGRTSSAAGGGGSVQGAEEEAVADDTGGSGSGGVGGRGSGAVERGGDEADGHGSGNNGVRDGDAEANEGGSGHAEDSDDGDVPSESACGAMRAGSESEDLGGGSGVGKDPLTSAEADRVRAFLQDSQKPSLLRDIRDDYSHVMLQIAYICAFAGVIPVAPFIALLTGMVELHTDLNKYLYLLQRPSPKRASGIGVWAFCLDMVTVLAIPYNVFITFVMLTGWKLEPTDTVIDATFYDSKEECKQMGGALVLFIILTVLKFVIMTGWISDTAVWVLEQELGERFAKHRSAEGVNDGTAVDIDDMFSSNATVKQNLVQEATARAADAIGTAVTSLMTEVKQLVSVTSDQSPNSSMAGPTAVAAKPAALTNLIEVRPIAPHAEGVGGGRALPTQPGLIHSVGRVGSFEDQLGNDDFEAAYDTQYRDVPHQ